MLATDGNARMAGTDDTTISLAGQWHFALDPDGTMTAASLFSEVVTLPGTTDTNQKGTPLNRFDETTHLSRRYAYKGKAWYSREIEIPQEWADESVVLLLERTKYTEVYMDGTLISCNIRIKDGTGCIYRKKRHYNLSFPIYVPLAIMSSSAK